MPKFTSEKLSISVELGKVNTTNTPYDIIVSVIQERKSHQISAIVCIDENKVKAYHTEKLDATVASLCTAIAGILALRMEIEMGDRIVHSAIFDAHSNQPLDDRQQINPAVIRSLLIDADIKLRELIKTEYALSPDITVGLNAELDKAAKSINHVMDALGV